MALAARCFVGRSFWVQLTNVCSWTLSINIHSYSHSHTHTQTEIWVEQRARHRVVSNAKTFAQKGKILDMTKYNASVCQVAEEKALQLYQQQQQQQYQEHMHILYMLYNKHICNTKIYWEKAERLWGNSLNWSPVEFALSCLRFFDFSIKNTELLGNLVFF